MTMVWGDRPAFAVDWDWQRGLAVWALAGRRSEPRFDRRVREALAGTGLPLRVRQCAVGRLPGLRGPRKADGSRGREAVARLRALAVGRPVTLLTATKELELSQAAVLAGLLRETT